MNKGFDPNRQCDCHGCEQARRINEARKRREHYTANPRRFAEQMAVFARMRETEAEFRARHGDLKADEVIAAHREAADNVAVYGMGAIQVSPDGGTRSAPIEELQAFGWEQHNGDD